MTQPLVRPQPLRPDDPRVTASRPLSGRMSAGQAARRLVAGDSLQLTDRFQVGLDVLAALQELLPAPPHDAGYPARRAHRRAWQAASQRLLAPVLARALPFPDAPALGFADDLYADEDDFFLPLIQVDELNRAWHWYRKGVHLDVLGHALHPFYGTYVPTRVTHLALFGTWLSRYDGARDHAVDVGTGCGVLAMMLARAGFSRVVATDDNPNAVESVTRDLARLSPRPPVQPVAADLLGPGEQPFDLVVFNPPWVQGPVEDVLDRALYFEPGLFPRFFDQAAARLSPGGRVVLVFSNLVALVQPDLPHPIEAELQQGRFELVQKLQQRVKPTAAEGQPVRRTRERVEVWELALSQAPEQR